MSSKCILTDQELIMLLNKREKDAFEEIYGRYWMVVYTQVLRMIKNEDDAKDITQEVFSIFWLKCKELNTGTNLSGFLFVCAKNKTLDFIAQKRIRSDYLDSLNNFIESSDSRVLEDITEKQILEAFEKEIQLLPVKMRQVFEFRLKQHLSYKEIADELDISDKTVKKQISNAIKILTPKLQHFTMWLVFISIIKK